MSDLRTVGELRAALATFTEGAPLLVQVVGQDGSAWSLALRVSDGGAHGFKWTVNPAILTASHPNLATLNPHPHFTTGGQHE